MSYSSTTLLLHPCQLLGLSAQHDAVLFCANKCLQAFNFQTISYAFQPVFLGWPLGLQGSAIGVHLLL